MPSDEGNIYAVLCRAMLYCALPCRAMSMCRAAPCHAQPNKERSWRRYDQDAASTATRWVPASAAPLHLLTSSGASYRLDVELGRLEFEVHPYMALEQQLVRGAVQAAGHSLGHKNGKWLLARGLWPMKFGLLIVLSIATMWLSHAVPSAAVTRPSKRSGG